jgi:o-succinylbenzoate---CoA ligase
MNQQHHTLLCLSEGVRVFLTQSGIPKGTRIALRNMDAMTLLAWIWGIARHQCTAVLLSDRDPDDVIESRCAQVQARHIFYHTPKECIPTQRHPVDMDRIAVILFTSGSTQQPKAVAHSLRNLCASAKASNINIPIAIHDRWLLSLALSHIGGLAIAFRVLCAGASFVPRDNTMSLGTQIQSHNITHLSVVSTQLHRLLQEKNISLSSIKHVLVGGGPIPNTLIERACHLPIHTTYGMTELCSQLCTTPQRASPSTLKTAGYPLQGWEVKISAQKEICARGAALFLGYWTEKGLQLPLDEDGFFHTGDQGTIDEKGRLLVLGRCDQMFISGGENIHPEEIERCLCSIPNVEAALVFSVDHTEYGKRPAALIKGVVSLNIIKAHISQHLPRFKHPDQYRIWPNDLPTQKPKREEAQKYFAQALVMK